MRLPVIACFMLLLLSAEAFANQDHAPQGVDKKAANAQLVVHGKIRKLTGRLDVNTFGDQIIISRAEVDVLSTLKGKNSKKRINVDIVGGTIYKGTPNELTMRVSSMEIIPEEKDEVLLLLSKKSENLNTLSGGDGYVPVDPKSKKVRGSRYTVSQLKSRLSKSK